MNTRSTQIININYFIYFYNLINNKFLLFVLLFFISSYNILPAQVSDPPHAVCKKDRVYFPIVQPGNIFIRSNAINGGSYDDKTPNNKLKFYLNRHTKADSLIYTCEDFLGDGNLCTPFIPISEFVTLYVEDEEGQIDSCKTSFYFKDSLFICPIIDWGMTLVKIKIDKFPFIAAAKLYRNNKIIRNFKTNEDIDINDYCPIDSTYRVTLTKTDEVLYGINTIDILKIQKHILGQSRFTDPLTLLAADVTNSKSITASDVMEIRKVLLGYKTEFSNVPSWRFLESNPVFKDNLNPWNDYKDYIEWTQKDLKANYLNFTHIKMGDVNGSTKICLISSTKRANSIMIQANTQESSTTLHYTLSTTQTNTLEGIQFALRYDADALELESITSEVMDITAENYYIDPSGIIKFSWSDPNMLHIDAKDKIINIHFHKKNIAALGNIYLDNSVMPNEWIDGNDEINTIKIEQPHVLPNIIVNSILPNPVKQEAIINIYSTTASKIKIARRNLQGQIIQQLEPLLQAGTNLVTLDCADHPNGVYMLQIQTADQIINKKIIIQKE